MIHPVANTFLHLASPLPCTTKGMETPTLFIVISTKFYSFVWDKDMWSFNSISSLKMWKCTIPFYHHSYNPRSTCSQSDSLKNPMQPNKSKKAKKSNKMSKMSFGRKRSCWKKNYSSGTTRMAKFTFSL